MKNNIAISVVIPAFNEEKCIKATLKSLIQQNFTSYEIVVVDNNSTDNTKQVVKSLKSKKIRIVSEKKQGVVFARQKGLRSAKGDIVAGADADSLYPNNWLSQIFSHFKKDSKVIAIGGPAIPDPDPWWMFLIHKYGFSLINLIYKKTGYVLYLIANNFAFRKKAFLYLGGYDTRLGLGGGDEIDALSRLRNKGKVIFDEKLENRVSSRRYRVGILKFIFVHSLYYYWFNYFLSKLFKKRVVAVQPVRET